MRLLILAHPLHYENRRFRAEGRKLGHKVDVHVFRDVDFDLRGRTPKAMIGRREIAKSYDAIYMRHFPPSLVPEALFLAEWAHARGLYVFEPSLAKGQYVRSKMYDYWKLQRAGLPVPKGFQTMRLAQARKYLKGLSWPLVAKGIHGSRGKYVYLLENRKDAERYLTEELVGFFTFQEYLKIEAEYRIIVIGGKAVGAMRKHASDSEFRHNVAVGARGTAAKVPAAWNRIAVKAAKALDYGMSGVDLAIVGGKPYLLEVNRMPAFGEFEAATGLNVARQFITHVSQNRHRRPAKRR